MITLYKAHWLAFNIAGVIALVAILAYLTHDGEPPGSRTLSGVYRDIQISGYKVPLLARLVLACLILLLTITIVGEWGS